MVRIDFVSSGCGVGLALRGRVPHSSTTHERRTRTFPAPILVPLGLIVTKCQLAFVGISPLSTDRCGFTFLPTSSDTMGFPVGVDPILEELAGLL